jgi:hypothetical protein
MFYIRVSKPQVREVAQAGSAPGLGPGGRRFESCLPDRTLREISGFFVLYIIRSICWFDSNLKPETFNLLQNHPGCKFPALHDHLQ